MFLVKNSLKTIKSVSELSLFIHNTSPSVQLEILMSLLLFRPAELLFFDICMLIGMHFDEFGFLLISFSFCRSSSSLHLLISANFLLCSFSSLFVQFSCDSWFHLVVISIVSVLRLGFLLISTNCWPIDWASYDTNTTHCSALDIVSIIR